MLKDTVLPVIASILILSIFGFFEYSDAAIEEAKLTALEGKDGDRYGFSVSISGDRAVVGAPYDDFLGSIEKAGAAYVYERDAAGNWVKTDHLTARNPGENYHFGNSVSISGDRIIIGAESTDVGSFNRIGAAYVFELDTGGNWVQKSELTVSPLSNEHSYGHAVSISGDTAMVTDYRDDIGSLQDAGSVYVYERDAGGNWIQQSKLTAFDSTENGRFGFSVSISGDRAIVGTIADDHAGEASGAAYVFERDTGGNWKQVKPKLTASDATIYDFFGWSVSILGDRAIVGAARDDGGGVSTGIGSSYVFERNAAGDWKQTDHLKVPGAVWSDTHHAVSVSLLGDKAIVSAPNDDVGALTQAGSANVFERDVTGDWIQIDHITASDASALAHFGISVSTSGDKAIVGAYDDTIDGSQTGSAWIFFLNVELAVWDGEAGDGLWSNPINWSKDTVPQSEDYIIIRNAVGFGSAVQLDVDFTISNYLLVEQGIDAASKNVIGIDSGNTLTIAESATLENHGELYIEPAASLDNSGTVNNEDAGIIENQGLLSNTGVFNNNDGEIHNTEFGDILNYDFGSIFNNGIITNTAIITNSEGKVTNDGSIVNIGTISNLNAVINNEVNGKIDNHEFGTIQNRDQSTINNDNVIDNDGRIINYCGSLINNNGIISGNPIVETCDTDGDGIFDDIDRDPNDPSVVDFKDHAFPIPTSGTIITPGSQTITIIDMPDPQGVYISADPSGGSIPAQISVCGGTSTITLFAGSQTIVTCGSVTIKVISETVNVDFFGTDGGIATATITEGNSVEFDPMTWEFIASDTNLDIITINYSDFDYTLARGNVVVVPEFNEIAIMILGCSVVFVLILGRKFRLITN